MNPFTPTDMDTDTFFFALYCLSVCKHVKKDTPEIALIAVPLMVSANVKPQYK